MKVRYLEYGGKLSLICLACMLGVAGAYVLARERIEQGKDAAFMASMRAVLELLPDAGDPLVHETTRDLPESRKEDRVYYVETAGAGILYAAQGEQQGYSSKVKVAVGARRRDGERFALEIVEVRVIDQNETPGLGTRVAEEDTNLTFWSWLGNLFGAGVEEERRFAYLEQYRGEPYGGPEEPGLAKVVSISGVTISSNATTKAVQRALGKIWPAAKADKGSN